MAKKKEEEIQPYTVGKWKEKFDNFQCSFCQHATLNEATAVIHYAEFHAPKPEITPPPIIPIYDRWGNEVRR